jgi:hypothetical protein
MFLPNLKIISFKPDQVDLVLLHYLNKINQEGNLRKVSKEK